MKNLVTLLCLGLFLSMGLGWAEEYEISGTVLDSLSQQPVPNVNITVIHTGFGTISDEHGYFALELDESCRGGELVFQHIAYQVKKVPLDYFDDHTRVYMQLTQIRLKEVQVEAQRRFYDYTQELKNIVSTIPSESFTVKGFLDAADIIAADQSTVIDENLNGRKTVSVRGSNDYEVTILYDGIRINSNFDNLFDLSLIDPSSLQQIDIIKGSNAAAFGTFGSAATINFISRMEQDYLIKFYQRIGSYDSGDWGVNLYKNIFGLKTFASLKRGGATLKFVNMQNRIAQIQNRTAHNMVNLAYDFGQFVNGSKRHRLSFKYLDSAREYENAQYLENLATAQGIQSFAYSGRPFSIGKTRFNVSQHHLTEDHDWNAIYFYRVRNIDDQMLQLSLEQTLEFPNLVFFFTAQHDNSDLVYDQVIDYINTEDDYAATQDFIRERNGFSSSMQFKTAQTRSGFGLRDVNLNISFEQVNDQLPPEYNPEGVEIFQQRWRESSYMGTISFEGQTDGLLYNTYLTYGLNYSIPTLYQQIMARIYRLPSERPERLFPENKRSFEFGASLTNDVPPGFPTFRLLAAIFQNSYTDKFRTIHVTGSPLTFFDNYSQTKLLGFEGSAQAGLLADRLQFNVAYSRYWFTDIVAFPFQPDRKFSSGITFQLLGFSVDLIWFWETRRTGAVVDKQGVFQEIELPEFNNVDLHVKKTFTLWKLTGFGSVSGRNIFSTEKALEGIALRDRRLYLTLGVEFNPGFRKS